MEPEHWETALTLYRWLLNPITSVRGGEAEIEEGQTMERH